MLKIIAKPTDKWSLKTILFKIWVHQLQKCMKELMRYATHTFIMDEFQNKLIAQAHLNCFR